MEEDTKLGEVAETESREDDSKKKADFPPGDSDEIAKKDEPNEADENKPKGTSEEKVAEDLDLDEAINLSEELAKVEDEESFGSLSDEEICDALQNDTWIEELECALLADCDPATLKKISDGRKIPASLRPDYWRTLLALNDMGKAKLNTEYDLPNQLEMRQDCEKLVETIATAKPLTDADKLRLVSDFESTLTTYVKARPELAYVPDNGWIDILQVLYQLDLNVSQLYQIFFRIVDRYIPKDLSRSSKDQQAPQQSAKTQLQSDVSSNSNKDLEKSIQAYNLLRLLIQYHDPELCSILDSKKVTPSLYVKDWFSALFARSCSPEVSLLIWDTHFKMADPFLIFFAAIVMVVNASDDLKGTNMTQSDMLNVLKSMPSKLEEEDIEDLYYLVSNHYTNSTPRSIRSYSHLFFMDTFGNTYLGNESPEDGQPMVDLKTTRLTSSMDLAQYLCLPIVPAEIFALDTAQSRSSPTQSASTLRYFLVDCRPAEQYNAGHLTKAFHLDCSLMLREPSSFATAVQALLDIQRQIVASKSNTGGQHLCFIGSGQEEEDQYVNMVVASFLQKYQRYVSIVFGGFDAIHDYVKTKSELKDSFNKYIVDHNEQRCKACYSKLPDGHERLFANRAAQVPVTASGSGFSSAQSLFTSTTSFLRGDKGPLAGTAAGQLISQSGASMFDNFTKAFVSKSNVFKERLVETLNTTNIPSTTLSSMAGSTGGRSHVSSQDKLGKRYTGGTFGSPFGSEDNDDDLRAGNCKGQQSSHREDAMNEPIQEVQMDTWLKENQIIASFKCSQVKGGAKHPGFIALSKTHLWILREIAHNKGFASIAAKRPLDTVVQITSKRKQPDFIIFRYGQPRAACQMSQQQQQQQQQSAGDPDNGDNDSPGSPGGSPRSLSEHSASSGQQQQAGKASSLSVVASDNLHIPQSFEVIRLIKREVIRIMDENAKLASGEVQSSEDPREAECCKEPDEPAANSQPPAT